MSAAWAIALPDSEKLVLLALADWSDDAGLCWPSVKKLAEKCSKSERTIQGALKSLEAKGQITRDQRPGHGCKYTVHPTPHPDMDGYSPTERHYVYRVEALETGEFYIGARSCYGEIEADDYMGSGVWAKAARENGVELTKQIVAVLPSRGALAASEAKHVAAEIGNPLCRNRKVSGVGALSRTGYRGDTPAAAAPRRDCAPQRLHQTPAAAAPNTSLTRQYSEANASSSPAPQPKPKARDPAKGTRLPETWEPTPADRAYAANLGLTPEEIARAALEFRNYWCARAGRDATKLRWDLTWNNRVLAVADRKRGQSASRQAPGGNRQDARSMAEIIARRRREAADREPLSG